MYRSLGFRGSSGFGAEVRNGPGRPTTSAISAACQLRLFPPGLRCAPAQPPTTSLPRVAQRWSLGFGLFRLGSSTSACPGVSWSLPGKLANTGRAVSPPSLSGADAGCFTRCPAIPTCTSVDRSRAGSNGVLSRRSETKAGDRCGPEPRVRPGAFPRECGIDHLCVLSQTQSKNPLGMILVEVN